MAPDEVRMLDNRYAILLIRGEPPVLDLKYDLTRHPAYPLTALGGGKPYDPGTGEAMAGSLAFAPKLEGDFDEQGRFALRKKDGEGKVRETRLPEIPRPAVLFFVGEDAEPANPEDEWELGLPPWPQAAKN